MKKSRDPLQDLVNDLKKSAPNPAAPRQRPRAQPIASQAPSRHGGGFLKSAGPGGMLFDFGFLTGNPMADNATVLLNRMGDPTQAALARGQEQATRKAFADYTRLGDDAFHQQNNMGTAMAGQAHNEWDNQFEKSLDQQVVEMVKREGVGGDKLAGQGTTGAFNKSVMTVGREEVVAQSETDAAVIEMMKSMGADLVDDDLIPEG